MKSVDTSNLSKVHVFQESDSYICGPCCMAMVYSLKGKNISVDDILKDFHQYKKGQATQVCQLARHFNKNGLKTKVYISTSQILSPAWKDLAREELLENLKTRLTLYPNHVWHNNVAQLLFYLQEGGEVTQVSYTQETIKKMLDKGSLIILCVDEDWLWGHRFTILNNKRVVDELKGLVEGHFILVTGYTKDKFHILDPFPTGLKGRHGEYDADADQVINASLTWDSEIIEIL